MKDLGYPRDVVELIGNIYTNLPTSFHVNHFGTTPPIQINKDTIQDDTLSPYLFIIFLDPLLWWLEKDNIGYHFKTSSITCNIIAYANFAILTSNMTHIQPQIHKLWKFSEWTYLDLNFSKCTITRCPNKSNWKPTIFKVYIQAQNIHFKNQPFPTLTQNKPYTYLAIHLVPSLKWYIQKTTTMEKTKNQSKWLMTSPTIINQKIYILNTVIKPRIAYAYYVVPFSKPDIKKIRQGS